MRLSGTPGRLVAALGDRAQRDPTVEEMQTRPWASATFAGARHLVKLRFDGAQAEWAVDRLVEGLEEAEFDLGTDLLVDIALAGRHSDACGTLVSIEAVTIEAD